MPSSVIVNYNTNHNASTFSFYFFHRLTRNRFTPRFLGAVDSLSPYVSAIFLTTRKERAIKIDFHEIDGVASRSETTLLMLITTRIPGVAQTQTPN